MKFLGGFGYFEKKSMLTPQLEPFSPQDPENFVHEKVPIQLQGLWLFWGLSDSSGN